MADDKNLESLEKHSQYVAEILKTMAHPGRLLILCMLIEGEKSVSDLETSCNISQSQVSQFLKRMQYEQIVDSRKDGKFVLYRIKDPKIISLMKDLSRLFCSVPEDESGE